MAYTFDQIFAADPSNPANVAQNAMVTIFAPGDSAMTPLTITTPDGAPLANPVAVNANGFGSAFAHATLDRVAWAGGGFSGFFTSYEGMKSAAVAAQAAAETAGANAAAVATAAIGDATNAATSAASSAATSAAAAANAAGKKGELMLNVKDFGAKGDGTTDDTASITNAVSVAFAAGASLFWPASGYKTTASVPNLHKVRHVGDGWVIRGGVNFYVQPSYSLTNTLFIDPAGSSTNDGLSASQPMNKLSTAFGAMNNYGPVLQGSWVAQLAAGTYNDQAITGLRSAKQIWIKGAPVTAGTSPVTIFDPGATGFSKAIAGNDYLNIGIQDIKAQNYKVAEAPAFDFATHCLLSFVNVWSSGNDIGFRMMNHTKYSMVGCVAENNTQYGVYELFGVVRDFKAGGTTNPTILRGNGKVGIKAKELCTGHLDGVQIYDNKHGIHFSRSCTGNGTSSKIYRNQYGVTLRNQSSFVNYLVDWKFGTVDANTVTPWDVEGSSSFAANENEATPGVFTGRGEKLMGSYCPDPAYSLTGSTAATTFATFGNLMRGSLSRPGGYVKCVIIGSKGGTAGAATIDFRFGGSTAGSVTIPASSTNSFKIEVLIFSRGPGKQTVYASTDTAGVLSQRVDRTYDVASADFLMGARVTMVSATDSITINGAWCYTTEALEAES